MHLRTVVLLHAALALVAVSSAADRQPDYGELTLASDKVVLGTVGVKSSHWADESRIVTEILIQPDVTLKGEDDGPLTVQILGGVVGDTTMTVSDGPEFPDGERVLLFLKREGGRFVVTSRAAGSLRASSLDAAAAAETVMGTLEHTTGRRLLLQRGLLAAQLNRASLASKAAASQVGCYSIDGAKWSTTSAAYKIGPSIPTEWTAAIDASTATWNAAGAPFKFVKDNNSVNELSFKDLVAAYGSSYSNTFAVTTTWSSTSTGIISKATIEMNTKYTWSPSAEAGKADVQNIMTHEFGHWMRLLDIYSPSTCSEVTMWGSAAFGETKKRTLDQADIDGFFALYPGGSKTLAAPTQLAPANGATGVATAPVLQWSASTGATTYDVYFGTTASPALVSSITGTAYSPGTLTAGTTYYWKVAARNTSTTAASAVWSFTVAGTSNNSTTPTLTTPANGATGVSRTPTLAWTAATNATSYDVYIGTSSNPALAGTIAGTSAQVSTLTAGTTYYWRVVAKSGTGSYSSATWSFTVAATAPSAPVLASPANGATAVPVTTSLAWIAAAGATSYDVYLGTSTNPALVGTATGTSLTVSGLTDGSTYYWRVVAKSTGGSTTSATWSFQVAKSASSAVTLLSPANGATGVSLRPVMQWSPVTGAVLYDLYVGPSSAPNYIGSVSSTSVTVTGFMAQTTYYWKVVARTATSQTTSPVASFKTGN